MSSSGGYSDGAEIVYEALAENDNHDAKPRRHGERTDISMAKALQRPFKGISVFEAKYTICTLWIVVQYRWLALTITIAICNPRADGWKDFDLLGGFDIDVNIIADLICTAYCMVRRKFY